MMTKGMKQIECIGMIGKFPTPKGLMMFWDTGKSVTPQQLAESLALQHSVFMSAGKDKEKAIAKIFELITQIAKDANVYPTGQAAIADDGRIFVTEPWYESKDE